MAFSPGLVNVLTCSSNYLAYHKSFHTSRENKPFYSNKRWTIKNKLINRSMRSDNLSKFHQRCGASLELAINIILPVCSNKTDALLQGQKNDGATEEIASTFKLVASKHAWCFSETTRSTQRRAPHWSYFNSYPRQWSQGHQGDKNQILVNWRGTIIPDSA